MVLEADKFSRYRLLAAHECTDRGDRREATTAVPSRSRYAGTNVDNSTPSVTSRQAHAVDARGAGVSPPRRRPGPTLQSRYLVPRRPTAPADRLLRLLRGPGQEKGYDVRPRVPFGQRQAWAWAPFGSSRSSPTHHKSPRATIGPDVPELLLRSPSRIRVKTSPCEVSRNVLPTDCRSGPLGLRGIGFPAPYQPKSGAPHPGFATVGA